MRFEIVPVVQAREWLFLYAPPNKNTHGNFAKTRGATEEDLKTIRQDLVEKFQNCREFTAAFQDCANRTGS